MLSFSVVTLLGSALLSLLHLPQDAIRWIALVALVAIGTRSDLSAGLSSCWNGRSLASRKSKSPTAATVSGSVWRWVCSTSPARGLFWPQSSWPEPPQPSAWALVVLTGAFAIGAALPLLFFALAGQRVAERVSAFRSRQREIRIAAGIVTILLAVALVFDLPAELQRAIPDYTRRTAAESRRL